MKYKLTLTFYGFPGKTKQLMEEQGIMHWPTPPESPDLNPIENVWASMKYHIRSKVQPKNKEQLVEGIKQFWSTLTPEACQKYINHMFKVVPMVVQRQGMASGY